MKYKKKRGCLLKNEKGAGKTLRTIKLQETGGDTDMGKQREKEKKSVGPRG